VDDRHPVGQQVVDLLLVGGTVVDGTGEPGISTAVGIRDGRIVGLGAPEGFSAGTVLDVEGRVVAPGFVDAHGHSDLAFLSAPGSPSKLHQGVTTEVAGNCGLAVAPVAPEGDLDRIRQQLAIVDVDHTVPWEWRSVGEYLALLEGEGTALNVELLAGHLAIRAGVVGFDDRVASARELSRMQDLVDGALREGACGLSTGLMYPPNSYADLRELTALGEVVAAHEATFSFHMRDYGDALLGAVEEALSVGRRSGCRIQVSHLVAVGRRNWGKVDMALALIDQAVESGVDVAYDVYPYLAGSTNLTQLFSNRAMQGGIGGLLGRLTDPQERAEIRRELAVSMLQEPEDIRMAGGAFPDPSEVVGRSVAALSSAWGIDPLDTILALAERSRGTATMVAFGRSEDDLRAALRHPRGMIGSDGLGLDPSGPSGSGQPHPRSYGCYPRLLARYVRDEPILRLEEAIARSTSRVADTFGLADRGVIEPGRRADIVVLDPARIEDRATFEDPQRFAVGVSTVLVNGQPVIADGQPTGRRPGAVAPRRGLIQDNQMKEPA